MNDKDAIGLVLSGGGAKGAFQVGAWKAICECGLSKRVTVISGTSVGAFNGAFIACFKDKASMLETFWQENIDGILSPNYAQFLDFSYMLNGVRCLLDDKTFPFPALVDSSRLEAILSQHIPEEWPQDALQVYASSLCRKSNTYVLERFNLSTPSKDAARIKKLMASAAFPLLFGQIEINGKTYIDGGWEARGGDNLPIKPILEHHPDIKTIIAVRCTPSTVPVSRNTSTNGIEIIEIAPKDILQGVLHPYVDDLPIWSEELKDTLQNISGVVALQKEYIDDYIRQGYDAASRALWSRNLEYDQLKW